MKCVDLSSGIWKTPGFCFLLRKKIEDEGNAGSTFLI